jgi:hypothetical protein
MGRAAGAQDGDPGEAGGSRRAAAAVASGNGGAVSAEGHTPCDPIRRVSRRTAESCPGGRSSKREVDSATVGISTGPTASKPRTGRGGLGESALTGRTLSGRRRPGASSGGPRQEAVAVWQRPHCPDWLYLPETPFLLQALMLHGPTLRLSSMISVVASLLLTLRGCLRSRAALHVELLALRHQLLVLERSRRRRLRLRHADRLLWVSISRLWTHWRTALVIVKPETVTAVTDVAHIPRESRWPDCGRERVRRTVHWIRSPGVHGSRYRSERSRAPPAVEGLRRVLHGISHASGAPQGHPGPACGRTTVRQVRRCYSAGQRPPLSLRTSRCVAPTHRSQCRRGERRAGERRAAAHPDGADGPHCRRVRA